MLLFLLLLVAFCIGQDCNNLNYPHQYVVYKLKSTDKVVFDGHLDEDLWQEVAWTEKFVDIEGPKKPLPYLDTWAKMRWDDQYLYIGGYLIEPNAWANLTIDNSIIFYDNDFEIFIDPDGSTHFYKELELNARSLNWNLLLVRPYLNGGPPVCNATVPDECQTTAPEWGVPWWDISPYLPSAVYINGTLNNPEIGSTYWSIEIGIPLQQYVRYNQAKATYPPQPGQYWRLDFSRVEHHIITHRNPDGSEVYWNDPSKPEENWVWQPTYVDPPDMHLPETWGYIQFADDNVNKTQIIPDPEWPVREALTKVYGAEVELNNSGLPYSTDLNILVSKGGLPSYVAKGLCAGVPEIILDKVYGFIVTVSKSSMVGHMRGDRYILFD